MEEFSIKMCEHVDEVVEDIANAQHWFPVGLSTMGAVGFRDEMTAVEAVFIFS